LKPTLTGGSHLSAGKKIKKKREKGGKEVGACGLVYWADLGYFVPGWPSWLLPFFLILFFSIFLSFIFFGV
jgi:hypothetical protein